MEQNIYFSLDIPRQIFGAYCHHVNYALASFFFLPTLVIFYILHLYIFLDVEFGRAQARDMLQHLWAGPISNASVDVVRGDHSVEVHAVGVTKVINILFDSNIFQTQEILIFSDHPLYVISFFLFSQKKYVLSLLLRELQWTVYSEK